MSNARNENPDTYRVFPCCGFHVKQVIPFFVGLRVLITTVLCLWLMFSEEISTKDQMIILWNSIIAAIFVYGIYERNKLAMYAYGYLEITAIIFHAASPIVDNKTIIIGSEKSRWIIVVSILIGVVLVVSIIYFYRVVLLYIQYLRHIQFFDNPPVIFVDKEELVPMNNTIKSRVSGRPEQSRIIF